MSGFEFIFGLFSVILSLSITEILGRAARPTPDARRPTPDCDLGRRFAEWLRLSQLYRHAVIRRGGRRA